MSNRPHIVDHWDDFSTPPCSQQQLKSVQNALLPHSFAYDPYKTFITVADADTIFHRDYFLAFSMEALKLPEDRRRWCMYQAPMCLFRNLEVCPPLTRSGAFATVICELGQLACSSWASCFVFSSYSVPLLLAENRFVRGWDADVIAEDHHMFMKCWSASFWDQLKPVVPGGRKKLPSGPSRTHVVRRFFEFCGYQGNLFNSPGRWEGS